MAMHIFERVPVSHFNANNDGSKEEQGHKTALKYCEYWNL